MPVFWAGTLLTILTLGDTPRTEAFSFASVFGDDMVLQRTVKSAVYGEGASPGATVHVTVGGGQNIDGSADKQGVEATEVRAQADGSWKAVLGGRPAGTGFTVTARSGSSTVALQRVAFGDVWFCSGQSNMELGLHYTFSVNETMEAITNDEKYSNIRLLHFDHNPQPSPVWVTNGRIVNPSTVTNSSWLTPKDAIATTVSGCRGTHCASAFSDFSATCWYFGESLTERISHSATDVSGTQTTQIPLGLIESAFGGTCIESWFDPEVQLASCTNITCTSNQSLSYTRESRAACEAVPNPGRSAGYNGELFHGMVQPFINMTVKGWLWCECSHACILNDAAATD